MASGNNWFVITGGPSTGKTTIVNQLQARGYNVVHEAARQIIDNAIRSGITLSELAVDRNKFQEDVLDLKIKNESNLRADKLTFLDRGIYDTLAYLRYYNLKVSDRVEALVNKASYRTVFVLEPLDIYVRDYARIESADFNKVFTPLLFNAYSDADMKTVKVPFMPIEDRLNFILSYT